MAANKKSRRLLLSEAQLEKVEAAASNGKCSELVKYIKRGWDVDQELNSSGGDTALHGAAVRGHTEVARVLCEAGANVNKQNLLGGTPLHYAAGRGHTQTVKCLVEHNATMDVRTQWGQTPLHYAAWFGHTQTVKCLVEHNATVDVRTQWGRTPLHLAAREGRTAVVQCLIEHRANVNVCDENGDTALHLASQSGKAAVVELLVNEGSCEVTAVNKGGNTSLHSACSRGHLEVVELLLKTGVDATVVNTGGNTSLHSASSRGHLEVVELLLKTGVDATVVNTRGETAYDVCGKEANVFFNNIETIKKIKEVLENHKKKRQETQRASSAEGAESRVAPTPERSLEFGRYVMHYLQSSGATVPEGWVDINIRAQRDESELGILGVDIRLSDYFPVTSSRKLPPRCSFGPAFDLNKETMSAHFHTSLSTAFSSVALIVGQTGTGSGFRVGPDYVMTNWHVAEKLGDDLKKSAVLFYYDKSKWLGLESVSGCCVDSLVYSNEDLDVAVLKLDLQAPLPASVAACKKLDSLPPPLTRFKKINKETLLHFAGHPDGDFKVADIRCGVVQMETSDFRAKHDELKQWSQDRFGFDVYPKLDDSCRALYKTSSNFGTGSSGCPGFVPDERQEASVAVVHALIFPAVPPFHTVSIAEIAPRSIEQGICIEAIYDSMNDSISDSDKQLCMEIFPNGRPF